MTHEYWVMDSELCDECGALLDMFGACPECGWDGIDWDEIDEEDEWDMIVRSPEGQAAMRKLAEQVMREIEAGEYEEGGFGMEED